MKRRAHISVGAGAAANLPRLPADAAGPVFDEPWQAQAFALFVQLQATGAFSWAEWTAALSDELKSAQAAGAPDDGAGYYHHWLAALERLVIARGLAAPEALAQR